MTKSRGRGPGMATLCLFLLLLCQPAIGQLLRIERCDPKQFTKKPHPGVNTSYLYCNTDGSLAKRDCPSGKRFNEELLECEPATPPGEVQHAPPRPAEKAVDGGKKEHLGGEGEEEESALRLPQFQAPDDICSGGTPLTKLGAPVVCNPTISSCPDGYLCTLHQRTGTSYCCQTAVDLIQEGTLCANNQVTFFEPLTGLPKTCALSAPSGCPTGFGCNLVGGAFTRCCGRDFGCPANSAGFVHPTTGSHVQCNSADPLSCPTGFICTQSSMFNTGICCSDTSNSPIDVCGGEAPLAQPNPCSASDPCPLGYGCRNGRCCPSKGVCPVGQPLGGVTSCSASGNPCPNNFQCVINNGHQYCCPSPEHVCGLPKDPGIPCQARGVPAVSRFYFDASTGSCRSFQFSQCGGNGNNFDTLEQCEGFCLEAQCPNGGTGLRAGPALATCTPGEQGSADTCPAHYGCVQPRFGQNFVCCSSQEQVCREPVSAGTPCFGTFLTAQRFQYDPEKSQCEAFQYFGCGGTGNNFLSKGQCEGQCLPTVRSACNGVAPLNDEGDYVQRCTENVQCPHGSWCNTQGYCCPHQETACTSPKSIGHTCLSQKPGTYWYFDSAADSCLPFEYSGCGGTPNRFADRDACERMCVRRDGECPRGMAPFLTPAGTKRCQPGQPRPCPDGASCIQSLQGEWLCCSSVAQCPNGRVAYVIPESDSNVACLPADDNCPTGFQCLQSANVPGYYMCCSGSQVPARLSRIGSFTSAVVSAVSAAKRRAMSSLLANLGAAQSAALVRYAAAAPKCPSGLLSNGERCVVNQIQACPLGYICIGNDGAKGICCKAQPKCAKKSRKPVYISPKQVLTCGEEEAGCPQGSQCSRSSMPGIQICCMPRDSAQNIGFVAPRGRPPPDSSASASSSSAPKHHSYSKGAVPKVVPKCAKDGSLPFFALGSRVPQQCTAERDDECPEEYECELGTDEQYYCCPAWDRCPAGASPFLVEGSRKPLGCNWMANNCPDGYTCEGSKDRAICCRMRVSQLQCPAGRSPYLYGKRPLACPSGSKRSCPSGFECTPSWNGGNQHLCCSTPDHHAPECVSGFGYIDPGTAKNQICDPNIETCPLGYRCKRSTLANTHVCCSMAMDNRYDGFCPPGQIPYTGGQPNAAADDFLAPPTCHMAVQPCPTNGPYQCVYSAEKQNSFCCAPVESAHRFGAFRPQSGAAAFPPRGMPIYSQQQQQQWQQALAQYQQLQQLQFHQRSAIPGHSAGGCAGEGAEVTAASSSPQQATQTPLDQSGYYGQQQQQIYHQQLQQQLQGQSTNPYNSVDTEALARAALQNVYANYGGSSGAGTQSGTASPQAVANQTQSHQQAQSLFVASCPPWSKPLLEPGTGLGRSCSTWVRCPQGFTCYSNFPDGRNAHCCTTVPLDNQVVFRANTALALQADITGQQQQHQGLTVGQQSNNNPFGPQFAPSRAVANDSTENLGTTANGNAGANSTDTFGPHFAKCPASMVNIGGFCKRMFFVGQPGCESDTQCSARTNGTNCIKGYCACPSPLLIYESECVLQCPEGFLNIAGRCHDLTTVVFMDSVESRENGTIGGFCLATVVAEEQCLVRNSYCSEKSLTCQCRPGYELRIDDIGDRSDKGTCLEMEGSRFQGAAASRKLRDHADDDSGEYEASDDGIISNAFYAVEFSVDDGTSTVSDEMHENNATTIEGNERKESDVFKVEEKEATPTNATMRIPMRETDDAKENFEARVLFQADD